MFDNPFQRSLILIGAALALPIIVLVVLQVAFAMDRERDQVERDALVRAEQIELLADARVDANIAAMQVLATSEPFANERWSAAYARTREVAALNPYWRNVTVSDLETRREVFSLMRPFTNTRGEVLPVVADYAPERGHFAGDIWREGPNCPCVYLHLQAPNAPRYLLTVALDPAAFQAILTARAPRGSTSAIVDQHGRFIARTLDFENRVGTPATEFVRNAVASGQREGVYVGRTYEGLENHSAFHRSESTGWSTHVAIDNATLNRPRAYSYLAIAVGALVALALAAGLIAYALNDIAQRKRAEERLAQTQKLEAIGQLTGGVAHDFNNLLTVMIGGLGMLLKRLEDPQSRQIAEHMLDAARRGDKLTKQLLAFSRGRRLELAPVDLHDLVHGMEDLLRRSIEPGVTLDFALSPEARWVKSDANQLELAVLNLAINARDAMPDGGRVEIAVRPSRKDDNIIELAVSDNGFGMPKDVVERAAEPFFTTKPAGKGTGLGLAQVFGAVRQSGGTMEIDSAPDQGTIVRLLLPRTEAPALADAPPEDTAPQRMATPRNAGRSILVVDDEPGVRSFMAETLRDAGYNAAEAEDPGIALARLEANPPDLLLTDFSMPGMNGLELAERARAKTPQLKVLIVSGYADAAALDKSEARPTLLRKPFDADALVEAVEQVLGK